MKNSICFGLFVFVAFGGVTLAQSDKDQQARPRIVITNPMPAAQSSITPPPAPLPAKTPNVVGQNPPMPPSTASNLNYKGLNFAQIKSKIAEAKREMQTRPITTAITEP